MTFSWPLALLGLLLVPLALVAYVLFERRREGEVARFGNPALFPNVVGSAPGWRRHVPVALLLLALTAMLVGVARPHASRSVPREEATVVLAMDVSFSMVAKDVSPTRLAAAEAAVRRFVERVPPSFRLGLVAFGTRAVVAAPATEDREVVRSALSALRPGQGTALGDAIGLSLEVAGRATGTRPAAPGTSSSGATGAPPAAVLLLSDGAQTQGRLRPEQAARRARRLGIPVYTVALGTPDGVVERPLANGFRERIRVPPDPETLRKVAEVTGGEFFAAPAAGRLSRVYEQLGSRLGHRRERQEITVAFAGASGLLLLAGGALSSLWFRRLP